MRQKTISLFNSVLRNFEENGIKILVGIEAGRTYECNIEDFYLKTKKYKEELFVELLQLHRELAYGTEGIVKHSEAILL